jgi:hypothetical protein
LPICALRLLWCSATIVTPLEKSILNFGVDLVQPFLGKLSLLAVCFHLCLKLRNAALGGAKLMRQPLRRVDSMPAPSLDSIGGFAEELKNRLTCLIELTVWAVTHTRSLRHLALPCRTTRHYSAP